MSCSDDDRYSSFDISLAGGPFFSFCLALDHKGTPKSEDSYFPIHPLFTVRVPILPPLLHFAQSWTISRLAMSGR